MPICRESRIFNTQGSNIDIILLCQTSFHRRDNIRPTRSFFLLPFIEMAINLRNTFFPFNSDASRDIYDLILTSFVLEYVKIKMNRH